jgi:predicted murein hydrolase (TIGR00659 family)
MKALESMYSTPLFGVGITLILYGIALAMKRRWKWLHPLLVTTSTIIVILLICDIPYKDYKVGGDVISFFLGPATVALAVPLHKAFISLKGNIARVVRGVLIGSVSGLVAVTLLYGLFGGSREILLSMLPKSSTSPVAIELARQLGGIPELGGVFAVLTGLLGSVLGPTLLRWAKIRDDIAIGTAIGTSAHGIGTARIMGDSQIQGGISGFAMGLSSIMTPILCVPLYWWMG